MSQYVGATGNTVISSRPTASTAKPTLPITEAGWRGRARSFDNKNEKVLRGNGWCRGMRDYQRRILTLMSAA